MIIPTVFLDANILASRTLRNWLFTLSEVTSGSMFSLGTSDSALAEFEKTWQKRNPNLDGEIAKRLSGYISDSCAQVITNAPAHNLEGLRDPKDQHIHSAVLHGAFDYLVTRDEDFLDLTETVTDLLPYEIMSPDTILIQINDSASHLVRETVIQFMADREKERALAPDRQLKTMKQLLAESGAPEFGLIVDKHCQTLATN